MEWTKKDLFQSSWMMDKRKQDGGAQGQGHEHYVWLSHQLQNLERSLGLVTTSIWRYISDKGENDAAVGTKIWSFNFKKIQYLTDTYSRFQKLLNELKLYGRVYAKKDVNLKFLRSLPKHRKPMTVALKHWWGSWNAYVSG